MNTRLLLTISMGFLLLTGCAYHLKEKEQYLRQAGFRVITPSTPSQLAKMSTLKPHHITAFTTSKGEPLYVMSDPKKNLLFIGNASQLAQYKKILYTYHINPEIANEQAYGAMQQSFTPQQWDGGYVGMPGGLGDPMDYMKHQ
jgi:hypothetical protein